MPYIWYILYYIYIIYVLLLRIFPLGGVNGLNSWFPELSVLGILRGDPQVLHVPSDAIHPSPSWSPSWPFRGTIMLTTALTSLFSSILCMCPYQRSRLIYLTFSCMLFTPSSFLMSTLYFFSQCYTSNSSQHPHLCFLDNLFLLLSNCPTFCSIQKYWSNDSHVEIDL